MVVRLPEDDDAGSRTPLAFAAAIIAGGGAGTALSFFARVFSPLEWLGASPTWELLSGSMTLAVLCLGLRHAPRAKPVAWVLVLLLVPAVPFGMMVAAMDLHVRYGTAIHHCSGELDPEESCSGRDWTFMQGRLRVECATGSLPRGACSAFRSGVAASLEQRASSRTSDGWVDCALAAPRAWAEVPCAEVGVPEQARCYECSGLSDTVDTYTSMLAMDASCEHVSLTRTVNMSPATAARCLVDTTRDEECQR